MECGRRTLQAKMKEFRRRKGRENERMEEAEKMKE